MASIEDNVIESVLEDQWEETFTATCAIINLLKPLQKSLSSATMGILSQHYTHDEKSALEILDISINILDNISRAKKSPNEYMEVVKDILQEYKSDPVLTQSIVGEKVQNFLGQAVELTNESIEQIHNYNPVSEEQSMLVKG